MGAMFQDARRLEPECTLDFDLCIVGAGPMGMALASELAPTGVRICLMECGGLDGAAQDLLEGEVDGPMAGLHWTRQARLGGTSGWWGGECRPLDALEDLAPRPWLGDAGWPVPAGELTRLEPRAAVHCGLAGEPFEPAAGRLAVAAAAPLALDPARFATRLLRYSATRDLAAVHRRPLEQAANVLVLLHAAAASLRADEAAGRIEAVRFVTEAGREHAVRARGVVLAAGGIENARLLLASRDRRPAGLGNDAGQVGRGFMDHLYLDDVARLEPAPGAPLVRAYARRTGPPGERFKAVLAPTAALLAEAGAANCCFKLASPLKRSRAVLAALDLAEGIAGGRWPTPPAPVLARLLAGLPGLLAEAARLAPEGELGRPHRPRPLPVAVVGEQRPDPGNRVTLSDRRDRLGRPRARLTWRPGGEDMAGWQRVMALLGREIARAGLGRLVIPDGPPREAALARLRPACHHMGTTRMSADPRAGVVDPDCRVHGITNLYVAGSSVFPTGGHANPMLPAMMLTLRLADRLAARGGADW
jgi:choline dehydrogenase-like flavoprotein